MPTMFARELLGSSSGTWKEDALSPSSTGGNASPTKRRRETLDLGMDVQLDIAVDSAGVSTGGTRERTSSDRSLRDISEQLTHSTRLFWALPAPPTTTTTASPNPSSGENVPLPTPSHSPRVSRFAHTSHTPISPLSARPDAPVSLSKRSFAQIAESESEPASAGASYYSLDSPQLAPIDLPDLSDASLDIDIRGGFDPREYSECTYAPSPGLPSDVFAPFFERELAAPARVTVMEEHGLGLFFDAAPRRRRWTPSPSPSPPVSPTAGVGLARSPEPEPETETGPTDEPSVPPLDPAAAAAAAASPPHQPSLLLSHTPPPPTSPPPLKRRRLLPELEEEADEFFLFVRPEVELALGDGDNDGCGAGLHLRFGDEAENWDGDESDDSVDTIGLCFPIIAQAAVCALAEENGPGVGGAGMGLGLVLEPEVEDGEEGEEEEGEWQEEGEGEASGMVLADATS